ncbi:MAG: hypothetical protein QXD64_08765 [Thermoplasmata archaeon]
MGKKFLTEQSRAIVAILLGVFLASISPIVVYTLWWTDHASSASKREIPHPNVNGTLVKSFSDPKRNYVIFEIRFNVSGGEIERVEPHWNSCYMLRNGSDLWLRKEIDFQWEDVNNDTLFYIGDHIIVYNATNYTGNVFRLYCSIIFKRPYSGASYLHEFAHFRLEGIV